MTEINLNNVKMCGVLKKNEADYYIEVKRQSSTTDKLIVKTQKDVSDMLYKNVLLQGSFVSENLIKGQNKKLLLFIDADKITLAQNEPNFNLCEMEGYICKAPIFRQTPLGRHICDLLIAVNNKNKCSYIPCISWGKNAFEVKDYKIGQKIYIKGRVQSREYIKQGEVETKVAYELSCMHIKKI